MLAGLAVELGLVADRATGALQEKVGAFTAGKFGLGAEVTCHLLDPLIGYLTRQRILLKTARASPGKVERWARTVGLKDEAGEALLSGKQPVRIRMLTGFG
jgi:hypothetical protein